jgi:hypothetical protein
LRTARLLALAAASLATLALTAGALARGQAAPQNLQQPTVEGRGIVGQTLTAGLGRWSENPSSYRFQWHRCDFAGDRQNCQPIAGATRRRYQTVGADGDHQVKIDVTACNRDGCGTADTKGFIVFRDTRPELLSEPTISGDAQVGETLTASPGLWSAYPTAIGYDWLSCDTAGNNCQGTGTRGTTYGVRNNDSGRTLRVRVTARNNRGSTSATSAPSGVVGAATGGGATIPVARVNPPDRLIVSGIQFSPNPGTHAPIQARFKVTDTRGRTIAGALVYVLGLPYGWVQNAPETPTGNDGWATITLAPTSALPRSAALVMFVRARKPGDNLLAGVSTRRLVQLRIRG